MNNNQKKSPMKTSDSAVLAKPPRALDVRVKLGDDPDLTVAKKLTNPRVSAGITVQEFQPLLKQYDINQVIVAINDEVRSVLKGDMSRPEEMLVAQAHTLDVMFNSLAQRAALNINGGYPQAAETYLRMALKAQSQCRTTLESLSEIKNLRGATFIKQQNVANQQQVNNGVSVGAREKRNFFKRTNYRGQTCDIGHRKSGSDSHSSSRAGSRGKNQQGRRLTQARR